jgi:hypothetical protein
MEYELVISYEDATTGKPLSNSLKLDISFFKGLTDVRRYDLHNLVEQIEKTLEQQKKLRESLDKVNFNVQTNNLLTSRAAVWSSAHVIEFHAEFFSRTILFNFKERWQQSEVQRSNGQLDEVKIFFRVLSEELTLAISMYHSKFEDETIADLSNFARELYQLSKTKIYLDGGRSVDGFNDKGNNLMNKANVLLENLKHQHQG